MKLNLQWSENFESCVLIFIKSNYLIKFLCIGTFWGAIADDFKAVEPPSGFQGINSYCRPFKNI